MAFEKYTDLQLKKYKKTLLITGIFGLILMCFALGYGIYQMNTHDDTTLVYLVPTVLGPIAVIPSIISDSMSNELKKREGKTK